MKAMTDCSTLGERMNYHETKLAIVAVLHARIAAALVSISFAVDGNFDLALIGLVIIALLHIALPITKE